MCKTRFLRYKWTQYCQGQSMLERLQQHPKLGCLNQLLNVCWCLQLLTNKQCRLALFQVAMLSAVCQPLAMPRQNLRANPLQGQWTWEEQNHNLRSGSSIEFPFVKRLLSHLPSLKSATRSTKFRSLERHSNALPVMSRQAVKVTK